MPIVSSTHSVGAPKPDGRRRVVELHTLNVGDPVTFEYFAPARFVDADIVAVRDARAARINNELAEAEFDQIVTANL